MSSIKEDLVSYKKLAYLRRVRIVSCDEILKRKGDINYQAPDDNYFQSREPDEIGSTALHFLSDKNSIAFKTLLENGADVTLKNKKGLTVLHRIFYEIYGEFIEAYWMQEFSMRLKRDSRIKNILTTHIKTNNFCNPSDKNGISHFHIACMTNHIDAIEFFLINGVSINDIVDRNSPIFAGFTPLHISVDCECLETVELLLKYRPKIYIKDIKGRIPLHMIIEKNMKIVDCIYNMDSNHEFYNNLYPSRNIAEKIMNMIFHHNDTNDSKYLDEMGLSYLHLACTMKDTVSIENYLENNDDINHFVKMDSPVCPGYTALHFAAHFNSEIVKLLVSKSANIEAKDADGVNPLDIFVKRFKIIDIHYILTFHSIWKNIELSDGKTKLLDLIFAMQTANQLCKFMDDRELDINVFVPFDSPLWPGYTILHLVVTFTETIMIANICSNSDDESIDEDLNEDFVHEVSEIRDLIKRESSPQEYLKKLNLCLNRGADITFKDSRNWTPLIYAFRLNEMETVEKLLKFDSKPINSTDNDNLSHLYIACHVKNETVVKKLLENGAEVNLQILCSFKWPKYENSFTIQHRPSIEKIIGSTPLHVAVRAKSPKIASILLNYRADVNITDSNGFTPIHELLFIRNHEDELADQLFFDDNNLKSIAVNDGLSHLHVASYYGKVNSVIRFLDMGADINAIIQSKTPFNNFNGYPKKIIRFIADYAGCTSLDLAVYKQQFDVIKVLLERGADIFVKDLFGWSLIFNVIKRHEAKEEEQLVFEMIKKDEFLQKRLMEDTGITMLHIACRKIDVKAVELQMSKRANVNAQVHEDSPIWAKYTALHVLMAKPTPRRYDYREEIEIIMQLLLKNGADVNLTDNELCSPIHLNEADNFTLRCIRQFKNSRVLQYTYGGSPFVGQLFRYSKNLNVNPTNVDGISYFHISCLRNDFEMMEHFLRMGVDVNQSVNLFSTKYPGCSPLHLILSDESCGTDSSRLETFGLLLKYEVNVNFEDCDWNTPLHYISKRYSSREDLLKLAFDVGADINARNMFGETAFEILLKSRSVNNNEIQIFVDRGCHLYNFNPVNNEGYLAHIIFDKFNDDEELGVLEPIFEKAITDSDPLELDEMGRSIIHNIVSSRSAGIDYAYLIQKFIKQGCDIDHQDNLGRTPLHTAVEFVNCATFSGLLENGADINITDISGKTAFERSIDLVEKPPLILIFDSPSSSVTVLATHIRKLQLCGIYVNECNNRILENLPFDCIPQTDQIENFIKVVQETKNINISSSITLFDFLSETGTVASYPKILYIDRQAIDNFFKTMNENQLYKDLTEIKSLLNLQYRKALQRQHILEQGLIAINVLLKFSIPELCALAIIRFLSNKDLQNLIHASFKDLD